MGQPARPAQFADLVDRVRLPVADRQAELAGDVQPPGDPIDELDRGGRFNR